MYQQLEGGFGSMRTILPMSGLGAKMGQKNDNLQEWDIAKLFKSFDSSRLGRGRCVELSVELSFR